MKPEKEDVENKEANTLMSGGELEELIREEVDANELKKLVAKEDEPTSPETKLKREEVIKTFPEMTLWGEVYKELKNKKMTPMFEVDEYIVQLNNELEATIVNHKEKNAKKMIVEDYVLKLLIEHNYRFLGTDGGGNHHSFCCSMSQAGL